MQEPLGTPVAGVATHVTVDTKPAYESWTFWFNMLAGLAAMLDWFTNQHFGFTTSPIFLTVVGAVNVGLRFKSTLPVSLFGGQPVAVPRSQS